MEDWLKQVKEDWNKTSDSEWYKSLRTDEKIEELNQAKQRKAYIVLMIGRVIQWRHYRHGSQ